MNTVEDKSLILQSSYGRPDTVCDRSFSNVGCAIFKKSSESEHLKDARLSSCDTSVSHTNPNTHGLTDCPHEGLSDFGCRTTVYHKRLSGLWRRGGIYQFRVRVPADLVPIVRKTHINRSLGTASYRDALAGGRAIAFEIAEMFEASRRTGIPAPPRPIEPRGAEVSAPIAALPVGLTIFEAWNRYLADPGSSRTRKTAMAYQTVRNLIVAILGKDRLVATITRQDCRKVLETLQQLPSNYEKRWPDTSPEDAIRLARMHSVPPMAAANCNGYAPCAADPAG